MPLSQKEASLLKDISQPFKKRLSVPINVRRYFTDNNGTIIDKNDPAVPAVLKVSYPVYLFNEYDRQGGYFIGNRVNPPAIGVTYLCTFTYGINPPPFFLFNGLSDVQTKMIVGDVVSIYTDSLLAPSIYVWIVQNVSKTALGSILFNSAMHTHKPIDDNPLELYKLQYYSDNGVFQWKQPFALVEVKDRVGNIKYDMYNPFMFKTPTTIQDDFIEMLIRFKLDQYKGMYTYMLFNTDAIQFNFITKIDITEPFKK